MELLYIYISHYRIFNDQAFSFSDKFNVSYDAIHNSLSISKNKNYIDIYPGNVIGISGIVGKNATGKTSLLDLIGERVEDRFYHHEIYKETVSDPFERFSIFNTKASPDVVIPEYNNDYFLLYYLGEDLNGEDMFIIETDNPFKYCGFIDSLHPLSDINLEDNKNHYLEKGWCAWVLRKRNDSLMFVSPLNLYNMNDCKKSIEESSTVVYFNEKATDSLRGFNSMSEEENRISIKKRYAILHERWLYRHILTVQRMMQQSNKLEMFQRKEYDIRIEFSDANTVLDINQNESIDLSDYIFNYRDFDFEDKTFPQKMVLDFMEKYIEYFISKFIQDRSVDILQRKNLCEELKDISPTGNSYEDVLEGYCAIIKHVFGQEDNPHDFIEHLQKTVQVYYEFLQKAKEYSVDYEYKPSLLVLKITASSDLSKLLDLFKYMIDEPIHSLMNREVSVMSRFLNTEIFPLSTGEASYLALFTSIRDQIEEIYPEKKQYILLFDEIEKSMHPEMCRQLITELIKFLNVFKNKEFQIIIASHSPFIAGDILGENLICLSAVSNDKDGKAKESSQDAVVNTFGQNIHLLLKKRFFLNSTFGEYSREIIMLVSDCVSDKNLGEMLNRISRQVDSGNSPSSKCIPHNDEEVLPYLHSLVNSIGEPIIKCQLSKMLSNWENEHTSKEAQIKRLKAQIKKLEQEKM